MSANTHFLVFGAGKSATVLIEYLKKLVIERNWSLSVADVDLIAIRQKLGEGNNLHAIEINITDADKRGQLIQSADIVISLMPPHLHLPIAKDCIHFGKHLLTASYVDPAIREMAKQIKDKNLLFLCEMGLDPGIDHMSAMQLIYKIKAKGGDISSFYSHCGGLVAPMSDDNPWHYKISWNPRNVVLAGKAGALYKMNGKEIKLDYTEIFHQSGTVDFPELGTLAYYANRDSLSYTALYALTNAKDFLRTTLRYPTFCKGWAALVDLKLTDEDHEYDTSELTVKDFVEMHITYHQLISKWKSFIADPVLNEQFRFLGLFDDIPIKKELLTPAAILQWRMEESWVLKPNDKDMIVMMHEIIYSLNNQQFKAVSSLKVIGEDHLRTAMAKTVGLPLAIAAALLADGELKETGLHIPIIPAIYEPVLSMLEKEGIQFYEELSELIPSK